MVPLVPAAAADTDRLEWRGPLRKIRGDMRSPEMNINCGSMLLWVSAGALVD
jgi:hypothetical protein